MLLPRHITWLLLCGLFLYMNGCASNTMKEGQASRPGRAIERQGEQDPSKGLSVPPPPSKPPSIGGSEG